MVNGSAYPFAVDVLEHLYLESEYSQPVAVLLSVCDEVPDDLLPAYYTPLDLLVTATTAILGLVAGVMIYSFTMHALARIGITGFFADMAKEQVEEAACKGEAAEETNEEREARTAFFWVLQLVLGIPFALDYFWTKSPHGTEKAGWQAFKCVHFTFLFLYEPFVAPMFICLMNAESVVGFHSHAPLFRPKMMRSLAAITLLLFVVWILSTLPYLPLVPVGVILIPLFVIKTLLVLGMRAGVSLLVRMRRRGPGAVCDTLAWGIRMTCACRCRSRVNLLELIYKGSDGSADDEIEKETRKKGDEFVTRFQLTGVLILYGYFPAMFLLFYKDSSSWGRLQTLVLHLYGKLVSDSFDFSFLTWPDLNLDIDFKLSVAVVVVAAERLQAVWAYFYYGRRKRSIQPSGPEVAPEGAAKKSEGFRHEGDFRV